ncbi:hypothetical protein ADIWIN_2596 [Winogradskyella psychrotolerans RS-3]|uniref:Uncharacterized protein n=2 Tax=Winogradskyella TaxID=286104 RepID=S7VQZ8_9FLAO|nr:hypothetical protein ADIWIN_2596 [Winogradskyella psychrotolerans RS-3]
MATLIEEVTMSFSKAILSSFRIMLIEIFKDIDGKNNKNDNA